MQQPTGDIFAALASPVRREILFQLLKGPRRASDLASEFAIGRPAVSEHLGVLRKAKLVKEDQRGRERYYALDAKPLVEVHDWLGRFTKFWTERLAKLDEVLEEESKKNKRKKK